MPRMCECSDVQYIQKFADCVRVPSEPLKNNREFVYCAAF